MLGRSWMMTLLSRKIFSILWLRLGKNILDVLVDSSVDETKKNRSLWIFLFLNEHKIRMSMTLSKYQPLEHVFLLVEA